MANAKKNIPQVKFNQADEKFVEKEELPLAGQKRKASESSFVMQARVRRQNSSRTPTKGDSVAFGMKRHKSDWQKFESKPCSSLLQAHNMVNQSH